MLVKYRLLDLSSALLSISRSLDLSLLKTGKGRARLPNLEILFPSLLTGL